MNMAGEGYKLANTAEFESRGIEELIMFETLETALFIFSSCSVMVKLDSYSYIMEEDSDEGSIWRTQ